MTCVQSRDLISCFEDKTRLTGRKCVFLVRTLIFIRRRFLAHYGGSPLPTPTALPKQEHVGRKLLLGRLRLCVICNVGCNYPTSAGNLLDLHKVVLYKEPGPCHLVPNADEGSEDLQVLSNGVALITSGMRFPPPGNEFTKNRKGRILKFDFNDPKAGIEEVKIVNENEMPELNPHGLSLWEDKQTGRTVLFVVNHPLDETVDYISIFNYDVATNSLTHLKSVSHPDFGLLNDVVAAGPESFYTTRYHYSRTNALLGKLEMYTGLALGAILFHDGKNTKFVDSNLLVPNGINISPDGKLVYVAMPLERIVKIYLRDQDNNITFIRDIVTGTGVDNINIDLENGDLWIGAHPVGHQVVEHLENPSIAAPSQVVKIRIQGDKNFMEDVFSEPATRLYASASADRFKDAILIGTVQHKLMYCKLNHLSSYHG